MMLVKPYLALPQADTAEPARLPTVVMPTAVIDADLPDIRPSPGQVGPHRDA
jgi:hypothetical protein